MFSEDTYEPANRLHQLRPLVLAAFTVCVLMGCEEGSFAHQVCNSFRQVSNVSWCKQRLFD